VGEKWIFSSTSCSFGYGYEAVRIGFKKGSNEKKNACLGAEVYDPLRLTGVHVEKFIQNLA
jgi:hypothetical protein